MFRPDRFPPFRPHPLVRGGHVQTLIGYYVQQDASEYRATQRAVEMDDGDTFFLHDDRPKFWRNGERIVLMVPGLDGSHRSPFMRRIAAKLNAIGFRTFRMDLRGSGPGYHLAKLPGHAGRSEDTAAATRRIHEMCPDSRVTAVGFSMGGNILLKMLGELHHRTLGNLDSCIAIAPPIDILACSLNMLRPPNRMYSRSFARSLLRQVRRRRPHVEQLQRISLRPLPSNLMEFDDRFTAPLSGFRDARDYYVRCSAKKLLRQIAVPTLILTASDDPMIPVSIFEDVEFSSSTRVVITESGGHLGYIGVAGIDPDRRWMDWRIVHWISRHHAQVDQ